MFCHALGGGFAGHEDGYERFVLLEPYRDELVGRVKQDEALTKADEAVRRRAEAQK